MEDDHPRLPLQVFAAGCVQVQNTIGLANPGISSDIAKATHKKQGVYGRSRA